MTVADSVLRLTGPFHAEDWLVLEDSGGFQVFNLVTGEIVYDSIFDTG